MINGQNKQIRTPFVLEATEINKMANGVMREKYNITENINIYCIVTYYFLHFLYVMHSARYINTGFRPNILYNRSITLKNNIFSSS